MVIITVKSGAEAQFLFETPAQTSIEDCRDKIRDIYNARLKVERVATEIDQLGQYGTILPDNMQGLNDEQIAEMKVRIKFKLQNCLLNIKQLTDPWTAKCKPSGGSVDNKDIYNRRNGKRPTDQMVKVLQDTIAQVCVNSTTF